MCSNLPLDNSELPALVWAPVTDTQKGSRWELPELVSTWMSSLIWFIAGPQEHLCWRKAG
ncbi:unnamed protein product, partial [Bubo scandiacus]